MFIVSVTIIDHTNMGTMVPQFQPKVNFRKTFTGGRTIDNDITILDKKVSKTHFQVVIDNRRKKVTVHDTGSRNGTKVDGDQVPKEGVEICVGHHNIFVGNQQLLIDVSKIETT